MAVNGALATETESPRSWLKPRASLTRSLSCLNSGSGSGLAVPLVSLAFQTTTAAVSRLMVPMGCLVWRIVRSTS